MATTDTATADVTPASKVSASRSSVTAGVRTYLGVALIVVWGLIPFYWMMVTALRDVAFTFDTTPWPTHVTLDNFKTAFSADLGNHFGRALANSLIIAIATTGIAMIVGIFASYALARLQFRGKFIVLGIILGASMFPGVALVTPLFQLFTNVGWIDTYQALIIPNISFVLPLTVYTLTAFFKEIKTRVAVEQAATAALADARADRWVTVTVTETVDKTYKQEGRGRPGPATRYREVATSRFGLRADLALDRVAYDAASDGCFPLITNDHNLTDAQVLAQ